jgi:3-methyladenine DNA glycosylase AlkD
MNLDLIVSQLTEAADSKTKALYDKTDSVYAPYGIRMGVLRALAKPLLGNHNLSEALHRLPTLEARMLSNMIADSTKVDLTTLEARVRETKSTMYIDQSLLDLAISAKQGWMLASRWIQDEDEWVRYAGYQLYAALFRQEDLDAIRDETAQNVLDLLSSTIQTETPLVRYAMNNCLIMAGLHVPVLEAAALRIAGSIGYIEPLRAKNDCNTQSALDYLHRYGTNPKYSRTAKLKKGNQ